MLGRLCRERVRYLYVYIYRYIETVTSLPDRQCPEQGRCFFVVQDFVLGVIYIYIYIPGLCPWSVYMHIYIYIQSPPVAAAAAAAAAAAVAASKSTSRHQNSKARKDEHATESHRKSA